MQHIEHLTLNTGDTRMSPRSEVGDHVIRFIRDSLAYGGVLGGTDWTVKMIRSGKDGHIFDLFWNDVHAIRSWMCLNAAASNRMWAEANSEDLILLAETPKQPRTTPWLAVALTLDAFDLSHPVLFEAGDLERCVAWTLIESRAH